jgi:hypothetical protein
MDNVQNSDRYINIFHDLYGPSNIIATTKFLGTGLSGHALRLGESRNIKDIWRQIRFFVLLSIQHTWRGNWYGENAFVKKNACTNLTLQRLAQFKIKGEVLRVLN